MSGDLLSTDAIGSLAHREPPVSLEKGSGTIDKSRSRNAAQLRRKPLISVPVQFSLETSTATRFTMASSAAQMREYMPRLLW